MYLASKISFLFIGFVFIAFGVLHFAFPFLLKWKKHYANITDNFHDTILTTNFSFSLLISLLGILNILIVFIDWNKTKYLLAYCIVQMVFMMFRTIYGLIKPIRVKNKSYNNMFITSFIIVIMIMFIPIIEMYLI